MENRYKIFKCIKCSNLIEKLSNVSSIPICCDIKMQELKEKTQDSKLEKHVPFVLELDDGKVLVKVGENENHPMTNDHYIQFIEVITKSGVLIRKNLTPRDKSQAKFNFALKEIKEVREYCNLHGLWSNKIE